MLSINEVAGVETVVNAPVLIRVPMNPGTAGSSFPVPEKVQCRKMVGWYDPGQLVQTGIEVAISGVFGRHSDRRLIEALGGSPPEYYDYADRKGDFWLDYVADIGDGWDSTYAVARAISLLSTQRIKGLEQSSGHPAEILVLGGDEVYPVASRDNYVERSDLPYRMAFSDAHLTPHVFAVPGNHDWYDSLVAFNRRFCGTETFAGCRTPQRRSYFALRLPHDWWLIGTDLQLGSDVDPNQLDYFRAVMAQARRVANGNEPKIILCHAEPLWMYREKYGQLDPTYLDSNLRKLEEEIFQGCIRLFLAGDQHHYLSFGPPRDGATAQVRAPLAVWPALQWLYTRVRSPDKLRRPMNSPGTWKITSGGGGAFLHATHEKPTALAEGLELKCAWPPRTKSLLLTFQNLAFILKNPRFGRVTALLYLFTCASVSPGLAELSFGQLDEALRRTIRGVFTTPAAMFWVAVVLGGFLLLTDTRSKWFKICGGLLHGLVHLAGAFALGWTAAWLCEPWIRDETWRRIVAGAMVLGGGWIVGSVIMGGYLMISLLGWGRHANETFSALRISGYKNFLRLRISDSGELTVHPVGLRRAPRTRRAAMTAFSSKAAGTDVPAPVGPMPEVEPIEAPIPIRP